MKRSIGHIKVCDYCLRTFTSRREHARFCSSSCRFNNHISEMQNIQSKHLIASFPVCDNHINIVDEKKKAQKIYGAVCVEGVGYTKPGKFKVGDDIDVIEYRLYAYTEDMLDLHPAFSGLKRRVVVDKNKRFPIWTITKVND